MQSPDQLLLVPELWAPSAAIASASSPATRFQPDMKMQLYGPVKPLSSASGDVQTERKLCQGAYPTALYEDGSEI